MRSSIRLLLCVLVALAASGGQRAAGGAASPMQPPKPPSTAPPPTTKLTPELKAKILAAMRLNRQTFQDDAVLERYGEKRPPTTFPAFGVVRFSADERRGARRALSRDDRAYDSAPVRGGQGRRMSGNHRRLDRHARGTARPALLLQSAGPLTRYPRLLYVPAPAAKRIENTLLLG